MSAPTMHTLGVGPFALPDEKSPWGVATSTRERIKVRMGPGAESWGIDFVRNYAPRAYLPGDWPTSAAGLGPASVGRSPYRI